MSSSTSAAWASVFVAAFATGANLWQAYEAHAEKNIARITKETLDAERREVAALQKEAVAQKATLDKGIARVNLYGDILAAEGGDRFAYARAMNELLPIMEHDITGKSDFLVMRIVNASRCYYGHPLTNETLNIVMHSGQSVLDGDDLQSKLSSTDSFVRMLAINTIRVRRMNRYLPMLADIVATDIDLNVVQFALFVIKDTLDDAVLQNMDLDTTIRTPQDFMERFKQVWREQQKKLQAIKPLELKAMTFADGKSYFYYLEDQQTKETFMLPDADNANISPFTFSSATNEQQTTQR